MYKKKISDEQFVLDCINKGFEIAQSTLHWDTYDDLKAYSKEHPKWYSEAIFYTEDQYNQWREYFFQHFYDWKPKIYTKKDIQREFAWFDLQYGPKICF